MAPRQKDWLTLIITYICAFISLIFIAIRLVCRRIRGERYWSFHDDMWMGVSVFPLLVRLGIIHLVIIDGTNSISVEALQALGGESEEDRILGSKLVLASRIAYPAFLWCMKACILAFLSRLMSAEPKYARAIQIIGVGLVLTFIGVVLATLLECHPFELYWEMPGAHCTKAFKQLITLGVLNIVTDLALIALPMPLIFRSRLPVVRKVQLSFLFGVSFAVIIVTVIRMPLILDSTAIQNSRTLWASIEIVVSCIVANAPILNNFYFEWKNNRQPRQSGQQMADDGVTDEDRRNGYSMNSKFSKKHVKFTSGMVNDSNGNRMGKGHARDPSEESLTRAEGNAQSDIERGDIVIEVGTEQSDAAPQSPVQSSHRPCLGRTLSTGQSSTHSKHVIQATTSVTQSVSLACPELMRTQQSRYYKGAFLGTQVWADQVFPGPKDPSQHVNYGMNLSYQSHSNGAHAHHHTGSHSHTKRAGHNVTDIPSLGVLPSAPPRSLLNAIANRKTIHTRRGSAGDICVVPKGFPRRGSKASESEEQLGVGRPRGASISSFTSGTESGLATPGIEVDNQLSSKC